MQGLEDLPVARWVRTRLEQPPWARIDGGLVLPTQQEMPFPAAKSRLAPVWWVQESEPEQVTGICPHGKSFPTKP